MRALIIGVLLVGFLGSAAAEDNTKSIVDGIVNELTNSYADVGDVTRLKGLNGPISGSAGDVVTSSGGLFTVWMIVQGWPAVMCLPGENPNTVGANCSVDEGVDLESTLIYAVGLKDVDKDTSTSLQIKEKRITLNKDGTLTLSMLIQVDWTRNVCESDDDSSTADDSIGWFTRSEQQEKRVIRLYLDDSDSSNDETEGGSSDCDTSTGTWNGWLSQTIPTTQHNEYKKTANITLEDRYWQKVLVSDTFDDKNNSGIEIRGITRNYSLPDALDDIIGNSTPKNSSFTAKLSWYEDYYRIVFDEKRQIYYGELINPVSPPNVDEYNAAIIYGTANRSVLSVQLKNDSTVKEFYTLTPFGRKNVERRITEKKAASMGNSALVLLGNTLVLALVILCIVRIIRRRR